MFLSEVLSGEQVSFAENDDGVFGVYFGPVLLGGFDAVELMFVADRGRHRGR